MQFNKLTKVFLILMTMIVTWMFFNILSSYFSTILWASILTVIFYPVKDRLRVILGERNKFASLFTVGIICLIVFIPLTVIISSLAIELNEIYRKFHNNHLPKEIIELFLSLPEWVKSFFIDYNIISLPKIQRKLSEAALKGGQYLAGSVFIIGKGTFSFAINFSIMLYLLFFLLKDGPFLVRQILVSLPLSDFAKQYLFIKFAEVSKATVKGTMIIALIQGFLGGIIFYIIGIDNSFLLGVLIAFLSLIPAIGSAIVWLPVSICLFITHQLWKGFLVIGLFLLTIGAIDNFLRPLLISKDTKIPDYLILIVTLGGIEKYGINGFIIGPLIATLFISCWNLLSKKDQKKIDNLI